MKDDDLVSQRAFARESGHDRATIARIIERGIPAAGRRGGHAVYERATLRRALDLDLYGESRPTMGTCPECWGFLAHHRRGKPCAPGSYDEGQQLDARWRALSLDEQRRLLRAK